MKILCLPGLGGHPSVFSGYTPLLSEHELIFIEFVNKDKALSNARRVISEVEDGIILFCHCYSAQMGIQLAEEMPDKIKGLIMLEPFFQEFQPWMKFLRPVNIFLLGLSRLLDLVGLRRKRFDYKPDYVALAKYPIFFQPFFDLRWQNTTDYLIKCYDILTYKLPRRVQTSTLMIFSPNGFSRAQATRARLREVFSRVRIMEMSDGTHNVITMDAEQVAAVIREELRVI